MKSFRYIILLLTLGFCLFFSSETFAQEEKGYEKQTTKTKKTEQDTSKIKKPPSILDKTEKSKKIEGLFTVYQDTISGSLQMIVTEDQLSKEFIYQSFSMGGPPALFLNQNMLRETWVFRVEKVFNKLHFTKVNTNFYFDPSTAISKAANADVSESRFFSTKIVAKDSTGMMLIAVDDLFLGAVLDPIKPNYPPALAPKLFNIGKINKAKSNYTKIRSFPNNTDFVVSLTYDNPTPKLYGGDDITDSRYVEVKMQHSFLEMPDNDYEPRYDDPRVGYFYNEATDMSTVEYPNFKDKINRWHLKKKNPNATLSEPVKPITWWVENTTPKEYRQIILEAGRKWNEAFEKAGFKNAVVMKMMPDDAEWDPADIRYNVIRWVSSDLGFAIGPSFVNPRTGEILGADITIDFGMLRFTINEEALSEVAYGPHYFGEAQELAAPLNHYHKYCTIAHGKKMQYNFAKSMLDVFDTDEVELEKLSEQFMTELILHEMGHTMGLAHNMKASNMLSFDELHDTEITHKLGTSGSVMDYTQVNIHSDRAKQGDYYSIKTGPYDWWAIEYGYKTFESKEAEKAGLKEILSLSTDPKLTFGNDADIARIGRGVDPRVQVWDQSSNMVDYAKDRLEFVNQSMKKMQTIYVKEGKSYGDFRNKFYMMQSQRNNMVNSLSRYIGGIYVDRSFPEQRSETKPFTPVPYEKQKSVMILLSTYIFSPNAFDQDQQLFAYLQMQRRGWNFGSGTEDPKVQNYAIGIQSSALRFIMHPVTMARMNNTSLYGNTYAVSEMIEDVIGACFKQDMKQNVNLYRRNLQDAVVKTLISINDNKNNQYDPTSVSNAQYALIKLHKSLKKAAKTGDTNTKAHRTAMVSSIHKALDMD